MVSLSALFRPLKAFSKELSTRMTFSGLRDNLSLGN